MNVVTRFVDTDLASRCRALTRVIAGAYAHIPAYRTAWTPVLCDDGPPKILRHPSEIQCLPLMTRELLAAVPVAERRDPRWPARLVRVERSGGSTGTPLDVPLDPLTVFRRQLRFLRGLRDCGYRPGQSMLLLTTRPTGWHPTVPGIFCADLRADPATFRRLYSQRRPRVVYGPLNALLLLADELAGTRGARHRPDLVVSTAEELSPENRVRLWRAFDSDPADFYGSSEAGLVAWRRPESETFRVAERDLYAELLPADGEQLHHLVLTDLRSGGCSPLIRYDTGDLVEVHTVSGAIARFHGRAVDCLRCLSGAVVTPYRATILLEGMPWITRYQLTQQADLSIDVRLWGTAVMDPARVAWVQAEIGKVIGAGVPIRVHPGGEGSAQGRRKFRPVRSQAGASRARSDTVL